MPESGGGDLSPDARRVVYSPVTRDFRHWKRYEGGWAQDLWILDLDSLESIQVTNHRRSDRDPMWIDDTDLLLLRPRRHPEPVLVRCRFG